MAPPIVGATTTAAVLAMTSNLLAQTIKAYQRDTPLVIDWVPVFQFVLYAILNTPPNFLWQEFIESTFPAYHASPTREAVLSASAGKDADEKLDQAVVAAAASKNKRGGSSDKGGEDVSQSPLVEPRLNIGNTVAKLLLDQTVGAAVNTVLFSLYIHSAQAAMHRPLGAPLSTPDQSIQFLLAGLLGVGKGKEAASFDYSRVSWPLVAGKARAEFVPIMFAGWKLWPLVSLINFTLVKTIQGRTLVGGLAGVAWGIYMSLLASS